MKEILLMLLLRLLEAALILQQGEIESALYILETAITLVSDKNPLRRPREMLGLKKETSQSAANQSETPKGGIGGG